jgi:hypothetical protein
MQRLVKITLWILSIMFALTAALAIGGVAYLWFWGSRQNPQLKDLPYLGWLLSLTIAEMAGLVLLIARKGLAYLPATEVNKELAQTEYFMERFLGSGSSATIVSNRLSWLIASRRLQTHVAELASNGVMIEIITPKPIQDDVAKSLANAGVQFYVTAEEAPPEARFTLINANRSGSEKLAIARGVHPSHEITVFDTNSGPQIIAMAQDIVMKAKRLANAASVGQVCHPSSRTDRVRT